MTIKFHNIFKIDYAYILPYKRKVGYLVAVTLTVEHFSKGNVFSLFAWSSAGF